MTSLDYHQNKQRLNWFSNFKELDCSNIIPYHEYYEGIDTIKVEAKCVGSQQVMFTKKKMTTEIQRGVKHPVEHLLEQCKRNPKGEWDCNIYQ